MSESSYRDGDSPAVFVVDYRRYLQEVRGLALNSCRLHANVVRRFVQSCFPAGRIDWQHLSFSSVADFLTEEFRRRPNQSTQRVWLAATRNVIHYLESEALIPQGWADALPSRINRKHAALPRGLSPQQVQALWDACRKTTHRHVRDRALLLVYTGLALRTEEVAGLTLGDIDWKEGAVLIRSTKTRRERVLPLAHDVGEGLIRHLRMRPQSAAPQVFAPLRAPFTAQRCHRYVRNCMTSLFQRAALPHARLHSLRHYAATSMVNRGATFKQVADVLGHKALATTMIYAKLDMGALSKVCLPWPGGAQ
jgi:integrase/recombinase XerD